MSKLILLLQNKEVRAFVVNSLDVLGQWLKDEISPDEALQLIIGNAADLIL